MRSTSSDHLISKTKLFGQIAQICPGRLPRLEQLKLTKWKSNGMLPAWIFNLHTLTDIEYSIPRLPFKYSFNEFFPPKSPIYESVQTLVIRLRAPVLMYAPKRSNMPPSTKFVAEDYLRPAIEIFGKLKKLTIIIQWDATDQDMSFGPLVSSLAGSAESLVIEMEYFGNYDLPNRTTHYTNPTTRVPALHLTQHLEIPEQMFVWDEQSQSSALLASPNAPSFFAVRTLRIAPTSRKVRPILTTILAHRSTIFRNLERLELAYASYTLALNTVDSSSDESFTSFEGWHTNEKWRHEVLWDNLTRVGIKVVQYELVSEEDEENENEKYENEKYEYEKYEYETNEYEEDEYEENEYNEDRYEGNEHDEDDPWIPG